MDEAVLLGMVVVVVVVVVVVDELADGSLC